MLFINQRVELINKQRKSKMITVKQKNFVLDLFYSAVEKPQNGSLSAGQGSFNSLCGLISTRTGVSYATVQQIIVGRWKDWMDSNEWKLVGFDGFHMWSLF